jgi:hypothetical protein
MSLARRGRENCVERVCDVLLLLEGDGGVESGLRHGLCEVDDCVVVDACIYQSEISRSDVFWQSFDYKRKG